MAFSEGAAGALAGESLAGRAQTYGQFTTLPCTEQLPLGPISCEPARLYRRPSLPQQPASSQFVMSVGRGTVTGPGGSEGTGGAARGVVGKGCVRSGKTGGTACAAGARLSGVLCGGAVVRRPRQTNAALRRAACSLSAVSSRRSVAALKAVSSVSRARLHSAESMGSDVAAAAGLWACTAAQASTAHASTTAQCRTVCRVLRTGRTVNAPVSTPHSAPGSGRWAGTGRARRRLSRFHP